MKDIEVLVASNCYERVNRILSLGNLDKFRRLAVHLAVAGLEGPVVDVGSGPGTSTLVLRGAYEGPIVMIDPSHYMLSKAIVDAEAKLRGIFEALPLADSSVASLITMFAFRDAIDFDRGLDEFARVLREDGRLVILDVYKPSNPVFYLLLLAYVVLMVPLAIIGGRCVGRASVDLYKGFLRSIMSMLTPQDLLAKLKERFEEARFIDLAPGVGLFYASRPKRRRRR